MDGDAGTLLPQFNGDLRSWNWLKDTISALAYHLKADAKTLIIGPGGGIDVLTALVFRNRDVTGVEINPIIVNSVMRGKFRDFTGRLYDRPEVKVFIEEGRSFIRNARESYDIIQATLVDTWAATSAGAFALTENNLYTVEAFTDYFSKLKPDGILTITRWNLSPPQQDLRLVSITRTAMKEMGIPSPQRCIMVVKDAHQRKEAVECNFMFKKSGFSEEEVRRTEALARENGFEILYTPLTVLDNPFAQLITAEETEKFYETYPFKVSPTYDNSPFFFHTIRLRQLWQSIFLSWESKKTNVGILVLFMVFIVAFLLVALFILGPLLTFRREGLRNAPHRLKSLSYFVCLGMAFILIEIILVQKFVLFLGAPVYALSVVLFSILLFSGLGSYLSSYYSSLNLRRNMRRVCLLISCLVLIYLFLFPHLLYTYVSLPLVLKALLVVVFLFPLSLAMGMPMPLGIQWLRIGSAEMIPWAWGINGSASVLGSILAILIAVNLGFNQALLAAAALYSLAGVLGGERKEKAHF